MTREKGESSSLQAEAKTRCARGVSIVKRHTKGPPKVIAVTVSRTNRARTRRRDGSSQFELDLLLTLWCTDQLGAAHVFGGRTSRVGHGVPLTEVGWIGERRR